MVTSKHIHPNPLQDRIIQYGAVVLCVLMLASAPLQVSLTLLGAPGGLFIISAIVTVLLIPPVLMLTAATPPITIQTDGFWLEPVIWGRRFVPWEQVAAVKPYPLLPTADGEVQRRAFVGKQNYQPAEGIMLVIPGLPLPYRIAAFFAGEGGNTIIALTNRTHTEYPKLKKKITYYVGKGA